MFSNSRLRLLSPLVHQGLFALMVAALLFAARPVPAQPRPSLTFGHETWPSVSVSNVDFDGTSDPSLNDLSIWTDTRFVRASYPMMLQGGRTYVDLQPGFQRIQFRHDDWTVEAPRPSDAYIIDLTILAQRQMSSRWSLVGQATPALKSGLEEELKSEDFAIEAAVLASRQSGDHWVLGFGVAYTTNFGTPIPIPLLQLEHEGTLWSGGPAWRGSALLPSTLETWVLPAPRLELGVQLRTLGDRHHLTDDGSALRQPYSDYFDTVVGPTVIVHLTPWLKVDVESGVSIYRQMQITDGRDEVVSFEPNQAAFLRWQVTLGGQSPLRQQ
jgi:hypothetical protein